VAWSPVFRHSPSSTPSGKTIDCSLLIARIIGAVKRGVRARLLVGNLNLAGDDRDTAALDAADNVSIKLFNPTRSKDLFGVCGGRGIADEVFELRSEHNGLGLGSLPTSRLSSRCRVSMDARQLG
jgi:hypothetical protein